MTGGPSGSADVVVVGAGVVGAACAAALAGAGLTVCVVERDIPAAGSSSSGEGNLLVSDKPAGPELQLALHSLDLWRAFSDTSRMGFEYEPKGGLVVAESIAGLGELSGVAVEQRRAGVEAQPVAADELGDLEPELAPGLPGGMFYPQDAQVQPMLAVRALLADAVSHGARVVTDCQVVAMTMQRGRVTGVTTTKGTVTCGTVVIAAGVASAELAAMAGVAVAVQPRRGHILVTEPLPLLVHHKVYLSDYASSVESDDAALLCSAVVEGTESGPILLGSTRELVGLDRRFDLRAAARIAAQAVRLFPVLGAARIIRGYVGFRPSTPDHLPVIGPHPAAGGVWLATGHEGAGIGLALGTADVIRSQVCGSAVALDAAPFAPDRPSLLAGHG